jgi:hypothetical protein
MQVINESLQNTQGSEEGSNTQWYFFQKYVT